MVAHIPKRLPEVRTHSPWVSGTAKTGGSTSCVDLGVDATHKVWEDLLASAGHQQVPRAASLGVFVLPLRYNHLFSWMSEERVILHRGTDRSEEHVSRKRSPLVVLCVVVLLGATLLAGCAPADTSSSATDAGSETPLDTRLVIFDMAHGEVFGPDDTSELGQSAFVDRIVQAGFEVEVNNDEITRERLRDASLLVLAGPMRAFTSTETAAIDEYVRGGGNLLMSIHVPFAVSQVPSSFGLDIGRGVVARPGTTAGEDPGVLVADVIRDDTVTKGVDHVLVLSGWPVEPAGDSAVVVVSTPENTGADLDQDGRIGSPGEVGSFGMVGVSRVGQGTAVIVGDDAIFANVGIVEADNQRLLDNILGLIEARTAPM